MSTLISVVIPSYNRSGTVGQTIESIINQKVNADIEIIIGDDCSTDDAREVLQKYKMSYPEIIRLIFHDKNIGLGANWATCVKECHGKYICNCDNDDYWHNSNKLQIQLDYMESHIDSNVLITDHRTHNRKTGEILEHKAFIDRSIPLQDAIWYGKGFVCCNASIMYRADFLLKHLPLDDYVRYQFALQDWNTWVILSAYTDFDIVEVSTATFGIETESITRPSDYEKHRKRLEKDSACVKYLCDMFPNKFHWDEEEWFKQVNMEMMNLAYKRGDYRKAKEPKIRNYHPIHD
ncbi:MAG: glycosyltransferase family 2 protein [Bacteroidales bacterium]|nr:glycosyltransferase family 2 protein [Bacteroidales bacterium]